MPSGPSVVRIVEPQMGFLFYYLFSYASYLYQQSEKERERKTSQEHLVK